MNTEQYLSQLRSLKRQIACKRRDAEMWRNIAENISVDLESERVQTSGTQDKMADAIVKATDCEREASNLTYDMIMLQQQIMAQIDGLNDLDYSMVLSEFYVHGMSLLQIANEWGRSVRHIKRVKADAMEKFTRIFGEIF